LLGADAPRPGGSVRPDGPPGSPTLGPRDRRIGLTFLPRHARAS